MIRDSGDLRCIKLFLFKAEHIVLQSDDILKQ